MKDLWPLIQQDVLGFLAADPFIGVRHGVAVEPGDAAGNLDTKVTKVTGMGQDGKAGIGFLVLPIEQATDENTNIPGGPLKLTITIQFVESVTLNRGPRGTQLPCRLWVAAAEKALKLYTPVGLTQSFVPATPVIHEFTPDKDDNLRVGQLEFTAVEADFKPYLKLARPQLAVSGAIAAANPNAWQLSGPATVTVTAPGAASIFYTTDNSHPYAGNPTAVPYTAPVTVNAPCLFRVRAFAPGIHGSDAAAANFYA